MIKDTKIETKIRVLMYKLMMVLCRHGITGAHSGQPHASVGVHDNTAKDRDNEMVALDDKFVKYVDKTNEPRPADQALHQ